MPNTFSG